MCENLTDQQTPELDAALVLKLEDIKIQNEVTDNNVKVIIAPGW